MIIVIKEEEGFKVGLSVGDVSVNMHEEDLAHVDNIPFWKVKGETGVYAACARGTISADVLCAHPELLRGIRNMNDLVGRLPSIRAQLKEFDLINDDEYWDNDLILFLGNQALIINSYFNVNQIDYFEAFCTRAGQAMRAVLEATAGEDAEKRILKACKHYDAMRLVSHLPLVIYNTKTGKRKVYYEYPKL